MLEHMRFFHMKGSVPCSMCSKVFPTSRHLRAHRKRHSIEAGRCPHCRSQLLSSPEAPTENYHLLYRKHLPDCRRCPGNISKTMEFMPAALNDKSEDHVIWRCLVCCNSFPKISEYEMHICKSRDWLDDSLASESIVKCDQNLEVSDINNADGNNLITDTTQPYLDYNPSADSIIDLNYLCIICGVDFESEDQLNFHLYESHQPIESDVEGTDDIYAEQNPIHDFSEISEVIFVCKHCGKEFSQRTAMREHQSACENETNVSRRNGFVISQTEERATTTISEMSFVCEYCKKEFPERKIMSEHQFNCKAETDDLSKNVKVEIPDSNFSRDSMENVSEVILVCKYCKKGFSDSSALTKHESTCKAKTDEFTKNVFNQNFTQVVKAEPEPNYSEESMADISELVFVCKYCKKNFSERIAMREHQFRCKTETDESIKRNCDPKLKEVIDEESGSNYSGLSMADISEIIFLCKYCKKEFSERRSMREHQSMCKTESDVSSRNSFDPNAIEPVNIEVPECKYSGVMVRWVCRYCKEFFSEKSEMRTHKKTCVLHPETTSVSDSQDSHGGGRWICKFCDMLFSSQSEMFTHMKICDVQQNHVKMDEKKGVLVKWVCKYCKKVFDKRENMQAHKGVCLLRVKDKTVVSSTESDMSEAILKDVSHPNLDFRHDFQRNFISEQKSSNLTQEQLSPASDIVMGQFNQDCEEISAPERDTSDCNSTSVPETVLSELNRNSVPEQGDSESQRTSLHGTLAFEFENFSIVEHNQSNSDSDCMSEPIYSDHGTNSVSESQILKETCISKSNDYYSLRQKQNALESTQVHPLKLKIKLSHRCTACGKNFPLRKQLKLHKLKCQIYRCPKCQRLFGNNSILWKHVCTCKVQKLSEQKQVRKVYNCKNCYRIFRERDKYKLHIDSCEMTELTKDTENSIADNIILPGQKLQLKIICMKCDQAFVGSEMFTNHSCDKFTPVTVLLNCECCENSFSSLNSYYNHSWTCLNFSHPGLLAKSSPSSKLLRVSCQVCNRQFDSLLFFYHHLMSQPACRVTDIANTSRNELLSELNSSDSDSSDSLEENPHDLDSLPESVKAIEGELPAVPEAKLHDLETEKQDSWFCSFCCLLIPTEISRTSHYTTCKTKFKPKVSENLTALKAKHCSLCGIWCTSKIKLTNHNCKQNLEHMASAHVYLDNLSSLTNIQTKSQEHTTDIVPSTQLTLGSIQKCVICHRKCRFGGVGLPPIGHLECFKCREKVHKKDMKKRAEKYYSRSSLTDQQNDSELMVPNNTSSMYLDPSKRLKILRAQTKEKNYNKLSQNIRGNFSIPTTGLPKSNKQSPNPVSYKCVLCKRGFSTEEQYQKHILLSKTCLTAEVNQYKTIEDIVSQSQCSEIGLESQSIVSPSQTSQLCPERVSSLFCHYDHSYSLGIETLPESMEYATNEGEIHNDVLYKSPVLNSINCYPNTRKRSYLVLNDLEKALKARPEIKRVPMSNAFKCDGWILNSQDVVKKAGCSGAKFICGGCYKSFVGKDFLIQHIQQVHKKELNFGVMLNYMKHIPGRTHESAFC